MAPRKKLKKKGGKQYELFKEMERETRIESAPEKGASKSQTATWGGNAPNPLSMSDRDGSPTAGGVLRSETDPPVSVGKEFEEGKTWNIKDFKHISEIIKNLKYVRRGNTRN